MKYIETGFRAVYDNFTAFPVNEKTKDAIKGFPGCEEADFVLTFGYISDEGDVVLEAIACGKRDGDTFRFFNGDVKVRGGFKAELVKDDEFLFLDRKDGNLGKRYADKLKAIGMEYSDEIVETRKMGFIDDERDAFRPDVVNVYLARKGFKTEKVQAKITGIGDNFLVGILLELPRQDFGAKKGDSIAFILQEASEGKVICVSNQNSSRKLTLKDLEGGRLLKGMMERFSKNRNQDTYIDVLEILRDSSLWVPCNVMLSAGDQKRMDDMIRKSMGGNVLADEKKEQKSLKSDGIRVAPELIRKGDDIYLPAFTAEDEMKSFGDNHTKVSKGILEWMDIAERNEHGIAGIVINPFSECFVLRKDVYDAVRKMNSSLTEN